MVRTKEDIPPQDLKQNKRKGKPCKLAIGSIENIVAHGTVYERIEHNEAIHMVPLGESNVRVSVEAVIQKDAPLPIPIPDKMLIVGEAVGFFVAWPKNLVLFSDEIQSPQQPTNIECGFYFNGKKTYTEIERDKESFAHDTWKCFESTLIKELELHTALHLIIFSSLDHHCLLPEAGVVGVNYGLLGNNLPQPNQVIALLKSRNITKTRLFAPNLDVLTALKNSGIEVILGTLDQDLQDLSTNVSHATSWINTNILPYSDTIRFLCISAGNEVIPGDLSPYVFPAMENLKTALESANLGNIQVTTSVSTQILGISYPPSKGEFSVDVISEMGQITSFLAENKSPLLVNVYPYFAYIDNPNEIQLSYALLNSTEVVVRDGTLEYKCLFDAIVDSVYSALEKAGGEAVEIVVLESGWPSDGDGEIAASVENAEMYNGKMIEHVSGTLGTPKRPGKSIETYVFAVFNENQKPPGTEQNFGLYYPNMTEVYHVEFN
ncbi:unnamed protein product [Camellia sinensis]